MQKRFKEFVGIFGRIFVALTSMLGASVTPAAANVDKPQSTTVQSKDIGAKIDAIRKAFESERQAMQDAAKRQLRQYAQTTQPFDEFNNFVSWLDFQSFQDFHNFGEFTNNI
jgi:hypothetical protein